MRKFVLAAAAAFLILPFAANAADSTSSTKPAEEDTELHKQDWGFYGLFGKFDNEQVQRGFQVYKEVCSACHSMQYMAFRNLKDLGYSDDQVKTLAATYQIDDGPNDQGDMFKRPGKPSDYLPKPFPNDAFARSANNGALPPDLSVIAKAREGGPDYIYNLLLGYDNPPAGFELMQGMNYNRVFKGHQIAMAKQVNDGIVTFADGAPNDAAHIAKDVVTFLAWVSDPHLEDRHDTGLRVMLYTLLFTVLAFILKRHIWSRIEH